MVDFNTYKVLHSDSLAFSRPFHNADYMDQETMDKDEPPPEPELYLFPPTVPGYNLRRKKWRRSFLIFSYQSYTSNDFM